MPSRFNGNAVLVTGTNPVRFYVREVMARADSGELDHLTFVLEKRLATEFSCETAEDDAKLYSQKFGIELMALPVIED